MVSTKLLRYLSLFLFLLSVLGGCATGPGQVEPPQDKQDNAQGQGFQPQPDPYQAQQTPLPQGARAAFARARSAMESAQWQQAEELLRDMTRVYPELSGPYVNLGLVLAQQDQPDAAAEAFRQAIATNELNWHAHNQLAILHRQQGRFKQAEALYLRALEVWPHNPVIHRNLGILYDLYMGRLAEALDHYQMIQKVAAEPDRRLEGWIVDLQRRIADQQAAAR